MVLVAVGGAAGSILRYLTDRRVQSWRDSPFPFGTLTVNITGSFILGFLSGWLLRGAEPSSVRALVAVGFCGGLTTFSTFGYETVRLAEEGDARTAVWNVLGSLSVGLAAAAVGWWLGSLV